MATDPNAPVNPNGPDPFASSGGGQFVQNVGWVDKNSPYYNANATPAQPTNSGTGDPTSGGAPGAGLPQDAQTVSPTPAAAPSGPTTNQGTQDTVRNTYLEQATQPETVSPTDPVIQAQTDAYRAQAQRSANDYVNSQAEAAGPYATGALRGQERMADEQVGQSTAGFQATLMGNELQAKRAEIANALSSLGGLITSDQSQALQQQLADLDAQIKTLGINTAATTATNQIGVQQELGVGGLNLGLIQALLGNQQFGNNLALQAAIAELGGNETGGSALGQPVA